MLLKTNIISITDTGKIEWLDKEISKTRYEDIIKMAEAGTLYLVNDTAFIWMFPSEIFRAFDKAYILTYLFNGQLQNIVMTFTIYMLQNENFKIAFREKNPLI